MGVLNALLVDFILRLFAGDDVDGGWGWSSYSVVVIILVISPLFCHKKEEEMIRYVHARIFIHHSLNKENFHLP